MPRPKDRITPGYPRRLLLVGVSVRMLAESCARAGIGALSLDWFGDTDTALSSEICHAVRCGHDQEFDRERLLLCATRLAAHDTPLVYAGGMDNRLGLLSELGWGRIVYGNPPDVVRAVKTPSRFFKMLEQLRIPHPATRLAPDLDGADPAAWLVKDPRSEGGVGVSLASFHSRLPTDSYLQQRLDGEPHSLLFLANGTDIEPVGFNRLLLQGHPPGRPFLFGGAIFPGTLSVEHRSAVIRHTRALTRQLGLVGLNSVDFIRDRHGCHILEINPRPSATLALHDRDYPLGLISAHIDACRGHLVPRPVVVPKIRGFRVVYAPEAVTVPDSFAWPIWASDRPGPGTRIPAHEPICSVSGTADVLSDLERTLFQREQLIHEALML